MICSKCGKENNEGKFCVYCGEKRKEIKFNYFKIILVILMLITIGVLLYLFIDLKINYDNLNEKYIAKEKLYNNIKSENEELKQKTNFLDENIVFVLEGYGDYYYTYEEMKIITAGNRYSYWAYNEEAAKAKGYTAYHDSWENYKTLMKMKENQSSLADSIINGTY